MCGREKETWEHGRRNVEGGGREGAGRRLWKQCLEERRKREMIKEIGKV